MAISVIGLGKLGLCTATCFAGERLKVIGYDNDPDRIEKLKNKECYIDEPGLKENLDNAFKMEFEPTDNINMAIIESNSSFIIVPTPSNESGFFSNEAIMDVLQKIVPALIETTTFHVVNIVSTVMPGSCHKFIRFLEHETGKKCGADFGLTYNPEFIAIGSVIRNFLNPDMVLIGGSDERSIGIISNCYSTFCHNIQKMSLISAEVTKLSLNCFLTMKISFANEIADLCENMPGTDVDAITNAIGQDQRIGGRLLKAGLGFSGPCLPRDVVAFKAMSKQCGQNARLATASKEINDDVVNRIVGRVIKYTETYGVIDIYGSSYKSGTKLTEGSQSIILKDIFEGMGFTVRMFDEPNYYQYDNAKDTGDKYPTVIIMMSDSIDLDISKLPEMDCLFIDPWRRYKGLKGKFTYYGLGICDV